MFAILFSTLSAIQSAILLTILLFIHFSGISTVLFAIMAAILFIVLFVSFETSIFSNCWSCYERRRLKEVLSALSF